MNKEFLQLISCFCDINEENNSIINSKSELEGFVAQLNTILNNNSEDEKFVIEFDGKILAPVPFASGNYKEELDIVVFGINPKLGETTFREKEAAGSNWRGYSNFYVSEQIFNDLSKQGLFGWTVNENNELKGTKALYYPKIIEIIASIGNGEFTTWESFQSINNAYPSKTIPWLEKINENFINLIREQNTLFAEFIPFHSKKFKSLNDKQLKLILNLPSYNKYLTLLFKLFDSRLSENGWIICNGKDPSQIFENVMLTGQFGTFETIKDVRREKGYSIHSWMNRRVLLCHHFLGYPGNHMKLASKEQIKDMIIDVINK